MGRRPRLTDRQEYPMPVVQRKPPRIARFILRKLLVPHDYFEFTDDVEEVYRNLLREDVRRARRWYWRRVLESIPAYMMDVIYWRFMMFGNYLKTTMRNIRKQKGYTFINIAGLAVGMACCFLILLWVQDEVSFDRFHKELDRLYRITVSSERGIWTSSPWALLSVLKQDYPEIEAGTWVLARRSLTRYEDQLYYDDWAFADADFLKMFTFPLIEGDAATALSDRNSVIVTQSTAEKYFGSENPMGRVLNLENQVDLIVTAIMADVPANSHIQFDLLARPVVLVGEDRMRTWSMDCPSYVMLYPDADADALRRKIHDLLNQQDRPSTVPYYLDLQPVNRIHLYALNGTDPMVYVYIFASVGVVVLLMACINFMNLSTARSAGRAREIAMRKAVGAERRVIIRQFLGESVVLSLIAFLAAVLLVILALPRFNVLASKELILDFGSRPLLLVVFPGIALLTGLISGSYPALFLSSFQPVAIFKDDALKRSGSSRIRRILIVFQFAAAVMLIACTMIIYRQMMYIRNADLGFDREHILTIRTNREARSAYSLIKQALQDHENIISVTAASSRPLGIGNHNPVYWEGRGPDEYTSIKFVCVDYDYFETFDMEMAYGRPFSREFPTDQRNYIINEAALRMTGYDEPIGKMFSMWTNEGQIVGVVKDFHATSLHNTIDPVVFVMYQNLPYVYTFVKIRPEHVPETIHFVENVFRQFAPGYLFQYEFLDDVFDTQYSREANLGNLLEAFTVLAIFIACLGLLGLASYMAVKRKREMALRKVLGARQISLVALLSKEFIVMIGIANAVAWPVAFLIMNRWMSGFAFHAGIGPGLFFIVGLFTLVLSQLTVGYQALRTARTNPVDALRYE